MCRLKRSIIIAIIPPSYVAGGSETGDISRNEVSRYSFPSKEVLKFKIICSDQEKIHSREKKKKLKFYAI